MVKGSKQLHYRRLQTLYRNSSSTFGPDNKLKEKKVIDEDTVLFLDPDTGDTLDSFGKGMFYVPHGLTVDNEGNVYVTDVGLHQVKRVSLR